MLGKVLLGGDGSVCHTKIGKKERRSNIKVKIPLSKFSKLNGETLAEFRQSVKKVEIPTFYDENPTTWILRANVYLRVHETNPDVEVCPPHLCKKGATIHFFNSLLEEDITLTWEELKGALLKRYEGHVEGDVYQKLTKL